VEGLVRSREQERPEASSRSRGAGGGFQLAATLAPCRPALLLPKGFQGSPHWMPPGHGPPRGQGGHPPRGPGPPLPLPLRPRAAYPGRPHACLLLRVVQAAAWASLREAWEVCPCADEEEEGPKAKDLQKREGGQSGAGAGMSDKGRRVQHKAPEAAHREDSKASWEEQEEKARTVSKEEQQKRARPAQCPATEKGPWRTPRVLARRSCAAVPGWPRGGCTAGCAEGEAGDAHWGRMEM